MTAATATRPSTLDGMRPVDPRRDMAGLADVIEIAFADSLDASGRRMVSEMRRYGRLGWLGWLAGHLLLPPAAYPQGFVWVDRGRIVGNASLMPVQGTPSRWVLANVAVLPDFRRRGIARALVEGCIERARAKHLEEIVLQVKAVNAGARDLYRKLGFAEQGTRVSWRLSGATRQERPTAAPAARRRRPEEWQAHLELAQRLAPAGVVWPHPLRPGFIRTTSWPAAEHWIHWVWPAEGPLQAVLSARMDSFGDTQLFLLCEPEACGLATLPLVETALAAVPQGASIVLESEATESDEISLRFGFREEHRLTWMRKILGPPGLREAE